MPRKNNKRKAIQKARRAIESGEVRLPTPQLFARPRSTGNSDLTMAVAMAFAAPRLATTPQPAKVAP